VITKTDIRNWVCKCQQKALKSILEAHEVELAVLVAGNLELKAIHKEATDYTLAAHNLQKMYKENKCDFVTVVMSTNGYEWNGMYTGGGGPLHVVGFIISKNKDKYPKEHAVVMAAIEKYRAVTSEYKALVDKCYSMKPKAAVAYLDELGFDTSTIIPAVSPINTSNLFVCNDNKPD
jgi:hypothetical protein